MKKMSLWLVILCIAWLLSACDVLNRNPASSALSASGTITVNAVQVAAEISGKILEIKADKGATVKQGDVLFRLDDQLLQAQLSQADAGVKAAQAALDMAHQKMVTAQSQYDQALQAARVQNQKAHTTDWTAAVPDKVKLPNWYFETSENINALQAQVTASQKNLDSELANLDNELKNASNGDFVTAEKRLSEAQQAYAIAKSVLDQAKAAKTTTNLQDAAQKYYDAATSELDAAQKAYDQMLTGDSATRVLEARARVAVARERLQSTQDALDSQMVGADSLQVNIAKTNVDQATVGVTQAEAGLAQAQAVQQLTRIQLSKMTVTAPSNGTVLSRPMSAGEMAAAGAPVIEIGSLDPVTLTVYIPEDQYGKISLGQKASVAVDSFPGRTFSGTVTYISNQAEFTPRNVQTMESRSTTLFKIEISLPNTGNELKPGMPADAVFE